MPETTKEKLARRFPWVRFINPYTGRPVEEEESSSPLDVLMPPTGEDIRPAYVSIPAMLGGMGGTLLGSRFGHPTLGNYLGSALGAGAGSAAATYQQLENPEEYGEPPADPRMQFLKDVGTDVATGITLGEGSKYLLSGALRQALKAPPVETKERLAELALEGRFNQDKSFFNKAKGDNTFQNMIGTSPTGQVEMRPIRVFGEEMNVKTGRLDPGQPPKNPRTGKFQKYIAPSWVPSNRDPVTQWDIWFRSRPNTQRALQHMQGGDNEANRKFLRSAFMDWLWTASKGDITFPTGAANFERLIAQFRNYENNPIGVLYSPKQIKNVLAFLEDVRKIIPEHGQEWGGRTRRVVRNIATSGLIFAAPAGAISGPTAAALTAGAVGGGVHLTAELLAKQLAKNPDNAKLLSRLLRLSNPDSDEAKFIWRSLFGGSAAHGATYLIVGTDGQTKEMPIEIKNGKVDLEDPLKGKTFRFRIPPEFMLRDEGGDLDVEPEPETQPEMEPQPY